MFLNASGEGQMMVRWSGEVQVRLKFQKYLAWIFTWNLDPGLYYRAPLDLIEKERKPQTSEHICISKSIFNHVIFSWLTIVK